MKSYKSKTMIFDSQSVGNCKIVDVIRNEKGEILEIIGNNKQQNK